MLQNDSQNLLTYSATAVKAEELLLEQGKTVGKSRSPEPRRRKYSLANVMKRLERKPDDMKENKEDVRERKTQKREAVQHSKGIKKGIFSIRNKHNKIPECEQCSANGVLVIPPIPSQLGYDDLLIEEVKPRSSSIIHASENILLSDVHRPRSPRHYRDQQRSRSEPPSPSTRNFLSPHHHAVKYRNGLRSDSGYEDNIEGSRSESFSPVNTKIDAEIRTLAQLQLCKVLHGKFFHEKQVPVWSKMISEGIMMKTRKLTSNEKKIITTVFIGEKFPGTVQVHVSCQNNTEMDNFQTISSQFNNIYAWVSVAGIRI